MLNSLKALALPVVAVGLAAGVLAANNGTSALTAPATPAVRTAETAPAAAGTVTAANWQEVGISRPNPGSSTNPVISVSNPPR